jgi:hypothetical protein
LNMFFFQNRVIVRKKAFTKGHFFKPIKYDVIRDFKMGGVITFGPYSHRFRVIQRFKKF